MNNDFCVNVKQMMAKLIHNIQDHSIFNLGPIPFFPKEGTIGKPHINVCI